MKFDNLIFLLFFSVFISCETVAQKNAKPESDTTKKKTNSELTKAADTTASFKSITQADYEAEHLDDPKKPNKIIYDYKSLVSNSVNVNLPADVIDSASYDSVECFVTSGFFRKYLNEKMLTEPLVGKDEEQIVGEGSLKKIPNHTRFLPIQGADSVLEYVPTQKYILSDSVYAFTFSQLTLPQKPSPRSKGFYQMPQMYYSTYLLIYDNVGNYIGGFVCDEHYIGMSGLGFKRETKISKTKEIKIKVTDYSFGKYNSLITTEIEVVFVVVNKQLKKTGYTKTTKKED